MTSPVSPPFCTFDGGTMPDGSVRTAYRPGVADVGGAAFVNATDAPEDPDGQPFAEDFNSISSLVVAMARVTPWAEVTVTETAGAYAITGLRCLNSATTLVALQALLVDHGTGDVAINFTAGTIPGDEGTAPAASALVATKTASAIGTTTGVRVSIVTGTTGAAVDGSFRVSIWGTGTGTP